MIIDLPDTNFEYKTIRKNGSKRLEAYIDQDLRILKVSDLGHFKSIMRKLTYEIYKQDKREFYECPYCHELFHKNDLTVDHIIPQYVGGPTITNNLIPVCKDCNCAKGNMPLEFFKKAGAREKEYYIEKSEIENEKLRKCKDFSFLGNWTINVDRHKIKYRNEKILPKKWTLKYRKKEQFYKEYGRGPKPIIVDRNYSLLGGGAFLKYAIDHHIKYVRVIVCDNIEVFYSRNEFMRDYYLYQKNRKG